VEVKKSEFMLAAQFRHTGNGMGFRGGAYGLWEGSKENFWEEL